MQPDLIARARSASTLEEEMEVIIDAVCIMRPDARQWAPLLDVVAAVKSGFLPRPVLLGVVAALVPEAGASVAWGKEPAGSVFDGMTPEGLEASARAYPALGRHHAPTPALALLIAIREAANHE